ncbi:hypothetical protein [Hymenobacter sp. BRD67]|uniref:hypothetical protein n=1 Tax=Hymenobacter sp. BRD67 TaxID=2675877 RepID=UPI00156404DE|nr:hypothetical protein [Hymenobacter sp. BRD67]QKG54026.1 hypothetical protein GKZ67_17230 [Hymenobacter sp. BRD67]
MAINTLSSKVAAATLATTASLARSRQLRTAPQRLVVSKVWDAMLRGARESVTDVCEAADRVSHEKIR